MKVKMKEFKLSKTECDEITEFINTNGIQKEMIISISWKYGNYWCLFYIESL